MRPVIGITCSSSVEIVQSTEYHVSRKNHIALDYIRAVEAAGGTPIILPHVQRTELLSDYLGMIDGLLLPGGYDIDPLLFNQEPAVGVGVIDPVRDQIEVRLIQDALATDKPIFGICKGVQILNIAAGGTIYQDLATEFPNSLLRHAQRAAGWYASHTVEIQPDSRLHHIVGETTTRTNSFHHQAIKDVAPDFTISAKAKDGVVEAIESPTHRFVLGVQYHPEMMYEKHPTALNLFTAFVKACQS